MPLILAVIDDLYTFARDALSGLFLPASRSVSPQPYLLNGAEERVKLPQGHTPTQAPEAPADTVEEVKSPTFRSTTEILESANAKNTVMYASAERVALHREPAMEFDGAIAHIPYGSLVMVLESRGRWARVAHRSLQGWVLRDELSDRAARVYPDLTIGEANPANAPATLRIRACIADEFGAGRAELPLQSSEYVLYRLVKKGIRISWPDIRPRTEGTWHEIFKGSGQVQIGVRACGGCIMEYATEDGIGHLAYVESVMPDDTITISEANYPADGIYNERVLTKEEWRELKPIFMNVQ